MIIIRLFSGLRTLKSQLPDVLRLRRSRAAFKVPCSLRMQTARVHDLRMCFETPSSIPSSGTRESVVVLKEE